MNDDERPEFFTGDRVLLDGHREATILMTALDEDGYIERFKLRYVTLFGNNKEGWFHQDRVKLIEESKRTVTGQV